MGGLLSTEEDSPETRPRAAPGATIQLGPSGIAWHVPKRYEVRKLIGRGSYGSVCEAYDTEKDTVVAIKQMKRLFQELIDCKRILRELAILTRLNHDNVVRVHDIVIPPDINTFNELCVVLEKCDMDLKKYIKMDVCLEMWQINTLFCNLLVGLQYIHECGIIHRDLKPANCLFNASDGAVKICDFGLARTVHADALPLPNTPRGDEVDEDNDSPPVAIVHSTKDKKRVMTKHVVTRWYRAPELAITPGHYTSALDVWSVGCIYAELLQMLENGEDYLDRGPLFPGNSCFPLSPARGQSNRRARTRGQHDQLEVIFDILGTPTADELAHSDEDARDYVAEFQERVGQGLAGRLPYVGPEAVALLTQMLRFRPEERADARKLLSDPSLEGLKPSSASVSSMPSRLDLEFETELHLTESMLRKHFDEEFKRFHSIGK